MPRNPTRIICLGPGFALRLVCYLGKMEKVVGVEAFEKSPPVGRTYLWANPRLGLAADHRPGGAGGD